MKLSKDQVNALANKVYNDLKIIHEEKIKRVSESTVHTIPFKTELDKYKSIFKLIDTELIHSFTFTVEKNTYSGIKTSQELKQIFINKQANIARQIYPFNINKNDITNSIILNTIEAKDLNELITKLNKEFSK